MKTQKLAASLVNPEGNICVVVCEVQNRRITLKRFRSIEVAKLARQELHTFSHMSTFNTIVYNGEMCAVTYDELLNPVIISRIFV